MKSLMSVSDHALHDMAFEACRIAYRDSEHFDIIDVRNMVAMILRQMRKKRIQILKSCSCLSVSYKHCKDNAITKSDIERTVKSWGQKYLLGGEPHDETNS